MTTFVYKLKDENGKNLFGLWEARDIRELKSRLRGFDAYFVSAQPFQFEQLKKRKVKFESPLMFTHRLSALIESGIPILTAMNILWRQTEEKTMQLVISHLYKQIEEGNKVSDGIKNFPNIFPFIYRALLPVAERTGALSFIFRQILEYLEYQKQMVTRTKKALIYPAIVMSFTILVLIGMFTFVVPTFQKVLVNLNADLPWITRMVINISKILSSWQFMVGVILLIAGSILLFRHLKTYPRFQYYCDYLTMKIPYFGKLFFTIALSRFVHSLHILMGSGLPIVESLEAAKMTVNNRYMQSYINDVQDGVRQGRSLYETFRDAKIFPVMFVEMVGVGESVGTVTKILENLAKHFDEEVDYQLNKLLTAIEPVLIIFVGGVVLVTMLAIYMPIFSVWNKLAG